MYNSAEQAAASLDSDDVDMQHVRLVQVATTTQLKMMLEAGVEVCHPTAALYLRVAKTCPVYWTSWSTNDSGDLDFMFEIPHKGSREQLLIALRSNGKSTGGGRVRLMRNKGANNPLSVSPGGRVVGAPCFGACANEDVEEEEQQDEEGEEE